MSLNGNSLWEVLVSTFSKEIWDVVLPSTLDTLYMAGVAGIITLIIGLILGIVLYATKKNSLFPILWLNGILNVIVNCLRSLPSMIMIIVTLPLARIILGKGYGANACIIALAASCIPMFARMIDSSLTELSKGKLEAAKAMGSSISYTIFRILLPESLPSLIRAFTVTMIAIISMTALAGNFGAGGIGDLAVRYGFQRYQHDMLFATIIVLIAIVTIIQFIGDLLSKLLLNKWHLT